jgi:CubicO group peptidase (beta-lactamase class C family)
MQWYTRIWAQIEMIARHPLQLLLLVLMAVMASPGLTAEQKPADSSSVDHKFLGPPGNILFWSPDQQIAGYRNIEKIFPTRQIAASDKVFKLPTRLRDLGQLAYTVDGAQFTLADFLKHNRVAGLLAIKKGQIVLERYALGNDENSRWINFSIAKSVVSMLVGAAIKDG